MKPAAWFGTLASFGQWWAARDQVSADVNTVKGLKTVRLNAPESIAGLSLQVPPGWRLTASLPAAAAPVQSGQQLLLPSFKGEVQLLFSY